MGESDPLKDPRALELLSALPDEIDAMGQKFTLLSYDAWALIGPIKTVANDHDWQGQAADDYRHWAANLPKQIQLISRAYDNASTALDTYGMEVQELQARFERLAGEYRTNQTALSTAQNQRDTAQQTLDNGRMSAAGPTGLSGPAATQAQNALDHANSTITRVQGEIDSEKTQLFQVLDDFEHQAKTVTSALKSTIQLFQTPYEVLPTPTAGKVLENLGPSIVNAFKNIGPDFWDWVNHPGDLGKLSKVAGDLGTVAATVGTAAALLLLPEGAPEEAGILATVLGVASKGGDLIFQGSLALQTGADVGRYAQGEDDVTDLIGDGLTAALDGAGKIAVHNADAPVKALEPQYEAANALKSALTATDGDYTAALDRLTPDQLTTLQQSGVDLSDPVKRNQYLAATKGTFEALKQQAEALDKVNAAIQYGGGAPIVSTVQTKDAQDGG